MNTEEKINLPKKPDQKIDVRSTFKINSDLTVKGFSEKTEWVPEIDNSYIFDEKNYKRYQDGKVISEDGWRFTNLGKLRVFSGDIKLTWKFKLDKQNVIVIKTKFQPLGKEYPFTYLLKDKFFEQLN